MLRWPFLCATIRTVNLCVGRIAGHAVVLSHSPTIASSAAPIASLTGACSGSSTVSLAIVPAPTCTFKFIAEFSHTVILLTVTTHLHARIRNTHIDVLAISCTCFRSGFTLLHKVHLVVTIAV